MLSVQFLKAADSPVVVNELNICADVMQTLPTDLHQALSVDTKPFDSDRDPLLAKVSSELLKG